MKLSEPTEELASVRLAPALDISDEHVKDFAVRNLWSTLKDFGCGQFEADGHIEWFWKAARLWSPKNTQRDFDRYARERISDRVGYSRRQADAWGVIDRLFDKARYDGVTCEEVIKAVTFIVPTQPFPFEVFENDKIAIVDVTKRSDRPKLLKIDASFLPILRTLYPWERGDDSIVKQIPIGTTTRELNLVTLPFMLLYPDASWDEREHGMDFHVSDRLDWTANNIYSFWREGPRAVQFQDRFWRTPTERVNRNGDTVLVDLPCEVVIADNLEGLPLAEEKPAKPTATASILNAMSENAAEAAYARGQK
jgi:hypothetical protein